MDEKKTIREFLGDLTPKQLWGLLSAVAIILSGTYVLGTKISGPFASVVPTNSDLVACSQASGYPMGDWIISGTFTRGIPVRLAPSLRFDTKTSGTVQTDEKTFVYDFTLDTELVPNGRVNYTLIDPTARSGGTYSSRLRGTVSPDGCYITGDWSDTSDRGGTEIMFWRGRNSYWVRKTN
jgi:hypothetical protein